MIKRIMDSRRRTAFQQQEDTTEERRIAIEDETG